MTIHAKFGGRSIKSVTFSNTAGGTVPLFAVTGTVEANVVCVCRTSVASAAAANISLGIATATAALIVVTVATACAAGEIWHDATPDREIELCSVINESIISDGNDIGLLLSAQVDSGVLDFYCNWSPLSADGLVVPA